MCFVIYSFKQYFSFHGVSASRGRKALHISRELVYGADKFKKIIIQGKPEFEPMIIGFWRAEGTQLYTANIGALDDFGSHVTSQFIKQQWVSLLN